MTDAAGAVYDAVDVGTVDGTTPGAAALVVTRDGRRLAYCAGATHRMALAPRVDERTAYDLASLTKMLCTTVLAARAVDEGKLALDERPWPAWPAVTVEHVLRHEGGLPAWLPLYERAARQPGAVGMRAGKRLVEEGARAAALEGAPGARTVYSDVGIIALGALLEERLGAGLDDALAATPAGAWGARFVPLATDGFHAALPAVAPTERCPWRRRVVHGQVHDENAFAMGGISAHAGLFGSLLDVERAARFFLGEMTPTLRAFARVPDAGRPVGFDRATPGGSTGDALSPHTFGHLGFTGCSLWIDPDAGAAYALLTNRIHEKRDAPDRILALRKAFHRAAAAWVSAGASAARGP